MLKAESWARRVSRVVWQYGLAVMSVAVALGISNSLERYTTLRTPLFYIAIIISAWFGGMGPGLLGPALGHAQHTLRRSPSIYATAEQRERIVTLLRCVSRSNAKTGAHHE